MHRWFHSNLNNVEAERLLLENGQDGSFLVRPSKSCAGHFSLSVRRRDKVTHIKIRNSGGFYDLHGGEKFATLAELIQHYTENQLKEKDGEVFELKKPLISSEPISERWFHGSISDSEAAKLILEKGVNGSFLVRESQSKIGDYVLTVRTKDELSQADKVTKVIIRYLDGKYDVGGGEKFDSLTKLIEYYKRNPMVEKAGTVVNMKYPFNATSITALDIDARVKELSKENPQTNGKEGFWEEFEHIQHQECKVLFDRKVGQEDRNQVKNRYRNILPYDYTRVELKKPSFRNNHENRHHYHHQDQQHHLLNQCNNNNNLTTTINYSDSDYINANYIKLVDDITTISPSTKPVSNGKIYIATQGPLASTVDDFWWMVWQEMSDRIVMVTKEVERGKSIKCFRYWPTIEQKIQQRGPIEVEIIKEDTRKANGDDYICREFEIRCLDNDGNNEYRPRRVVQYQYYAWPDQQTPSNPESVLTFLADINRRPIKGPLIVHCSAGIGRSGALIVIDMLIDQLKYHGITHEIDIQRTVKMVRAQRSGLVQTEAQYKFIYLAIQSYIASLKH